MTKARDNANNWAADITGVTAGTGITGGGTSGTVTVTADLSTSVTSTSTTQAATPSAVKSAYDLADAAIPETLIDAAGDIIYGSADNTAARLAIGTAGQVLTVNSGATAPEWAAISAGGWTQLGTGTLSGSSVSITGVTSGYKFLHLLIRNAYRSSSGGQMRVRINSNTNNQYHSLSVRDGVTPEISGPISYWRFVGTGNDLNSTSNTYQRMITFQTAVSGSRVTATAFGNEPDQGLSFLNVFRHDGETSVSSIELILDSGNYGGGTYTLFGEK